jgi:hypothetical protein
MQLLVCLEELVILWVYIDCFAELIPSVRRELQRLYAHYAAVERQLGQSASNSVVLPQPH